MYHGNGHTSAKATGVVWLRIWMYLRAYVNLFAAYTVEDISINGELTDSDCGRHSMCDVPWLLRLWT